MVHKRNSNFRSYHSSSKGGEFIAGSSRSYPSDAIEAEPLEVKVYNNFDKAFKAFRALVQKERILSLYKEKSTYEKPSDKRRRKRNEHRRKQFEAEMKMARSQNDERRNRKREQKDSSTSVEEV